MSRKFLNGIDAQSQRITSVGTAAAPTDAVNLAQVQALLNGLSWHGAVRAASTGNVTVSAPGAAIDGVTLAASNRVLLKNQTTGSENGVWIWNGASTALTRAADGTQGNLNAGAAFYIDEGSVNADTAWTLATDDPITVGTTALAFNKFGGGGSSYTAGSGISSSSLSAGTIAVDSTIPRRVATNVGDGSSTTVSVTHSLGTLDVLVQLILVSTGETIETDTVRSNANTVQFTFPSAPAASAYRAIFVA